jgi:hypothetical protein
VEVGSKYSSNLPLVAGFSSLFVVPLLKRAIEEADRSLVLDSDWKVYVEPTRSEDRQQTLLFLRIAVPKPQTRP